MYFTSQFPADFLFVGLLSTQSERHQLETLKQAAALKSNVLNCNLKKLLSLKMAQAKGSEEPPAFPRPIRNDQWDDYDRFIKWPPLEPKIYAWFIKGQFNLFR